MALGVLGVAIVSAALGAAIVALVAVETH